MSISFYAGREVKPGVTHWIEELDDYEFNLSQANASWLLGLIGIELSSYHCGTLTMEQITELLDILANLSPYDKTVPVTDTQGPGEPRMIDCGRSQEQVDGYFRKLASLGGACLHHDALVSFS